MFYAFFLLQDKFSTRVLSVTDEIYPKDIIQYFRIWKCVSPPFINMSNIEQSIL